MERLQLQPSRSAPDLTDLLQARLRDKRNHVESGLHYSPDADEGEDGYDAGSAAVQHGDDNYHHSWRDHQLPTPATSRSPTPEIGTVGQHHRSGSDGYVFHQDFQGGELANKHANAADGSGFLPRKSYSEHGATGSHTPSSELDARPNTGREGSTEPPSPASPSQSQVLPSLGTRFLPATLWDYLREEISASELDGSQELKAERVTNFFAVPMAVEQIIVFGYFVCLDSFLYTFTILPLRFAIALHRWVSSYLKPGKRRSLPVSAKIDLAKFAIFLVACITLHHITDASKMYHSVRGQEVIKLYVIFNVLEIADRLCCSFGQDLLDSLCSRATLGRREDGSQPRIRPAGLFTMCVVYTITHTLVLFYSLVSLNVAINSYDNALLTLLLSNQFVEIKGAVFKKFEKENLFQMSCADIVERFQLSLMLCIIALRNLIELNGSTFSLLPTSFIPVMPSLSILQGIFSPVLIVVASEMFVDWLKHAFITKFNHIRPAVYGRFIDVLCRDLVTGDPNASNSAFADQSPALARRLGFAALPVGCLIVRVIFQTIEMLADTSHMDECAPPQKLTVARGILSYLTIGPEGQARIFSWLLYILIGSILWACLVTIKLLIGINLRAFAISRYANMQERAAEDQRNDRSRPHIGVGQAEMMQDTEVKNLIEKQDYDTPGKFTGKIGAGQPTTTMETLSRFSMIKSRIY